MDLIVGTFNTPHLYTLHFTPPTSSSTHNASLQITARTPAIGSHSWLTLNARKTHLYATAWTEPPSIAAYRLERSRTSTVSDTAAVTPHLINNASIASRSGYACVSDKYVYSAGGPSGEVFALRLDGGVGACVQRLSFVNEEVGTGSEARPHGDFGGLRHGAHSADLSPDARTLYVADIGRNCVWVYSVANLEGSEGERDGDVGVLTLRTKQIAPREGDGPRHATPHPNGGVLYVVQEHSCIVDVYTVAGDGVTLTHQKGVRIIPEEVSEKAYWADEVRVSASGDGRPKFLYASTRGLKKETMGYVAVFRLDEEGNVVGDALEIWETSTSGGWANAVEPAPMSGNSGPEWLALTDSEEGWVFVLGFHEGRILEVARCKLEPETSGEVPGAATAVWL